MITIMITETVTATQFREFLRIYKEEMGVPVPAMPAPAPALRSPGRPPKISPGVQAVLDKQDTEAPMPTGISESDLGEIDVGDF